MGGLGNPNRPNVVPSTQGGVCRTEKENGQARGAGESNQAD